MVARIHCAIRLGAYTIVAAQREIETDAIALKARTAQWRFAFPEVGGQLPLAVIFTMTNLAPPEEIAPAKPEREKEIEFTL